MKKGILALIICINMFYLSGCTAKAQEKAQSEPKNITISAAASLKEALDDIKPKFEQSNNIKLTFNLGASGTLQKQIEEGAPVDLFISAGKKQMDTLESKNLIDRDSRKDILKNRLVIVAAREYKDKIKTIQDLVNMDVKISIGEPETVPAGQYAKESLKNMGLWDKLNGKMVLTKDVKQALAYVEKGEVAAGIVYGSDATVIKESEVVQTLEESTHSPIVYPAAVISAGKDKNSAKVFLEYLSSEEAKQIFKKYGFNAAAD